MKSLIKGFQIFFSVLTPFFLLLTSIWILFHPWIFHFEYNRPGFPEDPYGFTTEERLKWAKVSLDYLLNDSDDDFLTQFELSDGSPLYNEREISHMLDVKNLLQKAYSAWYGGIAVILVTGLLSWRLGRWREFFGSLYRGGWLTLALIAAAVLGIFLGFDALFTAFHRLFFTGDTWLFAYSDTLIRLFPIVFWQDVFLAAGGFTIVFALGLILCFRNYRFY